MNDGMGAYVVDQTIKHMLKKGIQVLHSNILIMGFTFKENCPDTRNTKVIDIYKELGEYGITPIVVDPQADADEAARLYGITFNSLEDVRDMDAVIMAVAHEDFKDYKPEDISGFFSAEHKTKVFLDIKGIYDMNDYKAPEFDYWRL